MRGPGLLRYAVLTRKSTRRPGPYAAYHTYRTRRHFAAAARAGALTGSALLPGYGSAGRSLAGECGVGGLATYALRCACSAETLMPFGIQAEMVWRCSVGVRQRELARAPLAQSAAGRLVVAQRSQGSPLDHCPALDGMELAGDCGSLAGSGAAAGMAADPAGGSAG
jgi:hypothetical protein